MIAARIQRTSRKSSQEQCSILLELMRDYQSLKSTVTKVIENTEEVAVIKSLLKDQEDIRRIMTKNELNDRQ